MTVERDRLAEVVMAALARPGMAGYRLPDRPSDLAYTVVDALSEPKVNYCIEGTHAEIEKAARAAALREVAEHLSEAMSEAYEYDGDTADIDTQPLLPFVDDFRAFWDPFAAKVAAILTEATGASEK